MRYNKGKRVIAALLSAAMVFTMTPSMIFAAENMDGTENAVAEESEVTQEQETEENAESTVIEEETVLEDEAEKEELPTSLADEEDYKNLKVITPMAEYTDENGEIHYVEQDELPVGNEDTCHLTINKNGLSAESDVEICYSVTRDGDKVMVTDSTDIPRESYLWARATAVKPEKAIVCNTLYTHEGDVASGTNGCFYEAAEESGYVYCYYANQDIMIELTEADLHTLSFDVIQSEAIGSNLSREDFIVKRMDGTIVDDNTKIAVGDVISVDLAKTLEDSHILKVWFQNSSTMYISNDNADSFNHWMHISEDDLVLHAQEVEQGAIVNEYSDYVAFYTDGSYSTLLEGEKYNQDSGIYVKLLKDMEDDYYFQVGKTALSNEQRTGYFYVQEDKIEVKKCKKSKLRLNLGDDAELFHFYSDREYIKELKQGDVVLPYTYIYVVLDVDKADATKSYELQRNCFNNGSSFKTINVANASASFGVWDDIEEDSYIEISLNRIQSSSHHIIIDRTGLSDASQMEISYSETYVGKRTVITDAADIPNEGYIWVHAVSLNPDHALALCSNDIYSNKYFYSSVGEQYLHVTEDVTLNCTEQKLYPLNVDIEEAAGDSSNLSRNNFIIKRSDGTVVEDGVKIAKEDYLDVQYTGDILSGSQIKIWIADTTYFLNADTKSKRIRISEENPTLHIKEMEQGELTIIIPEEYQNCIKVSKDAAGFEEIFNGDAFLCQTSLYLTYDGTPVTGAAGLQVNLSSPQTSSNTEYLKSGERKRIDYWMGYEEDCTLTISEYQKRTVTIENGSGDGVGVYADSGYTQEIKDSFLSDYGESFYVKVLHNAPDGYHYQICEENVYNEGYTEYELTDLKVLNSFDLKKVRIYLKENPKPISISNDYVEEIALYKDSEYTSPLNDGDVYNGMVYVKLLQELEPDCNYYYQVGTSDYSSTKLADNSKVHSFNVSEGENITVLRCERPKVLFALGEQSNLIHFYSDEACTQEMTSGDRIVMDDTFYAKLDTNAAEENKDYQLIVVTSEYYAYGSKLNTDYPMGTICARGNSDNVEVKVYVEVQDRYLFQPTVEAGYEAYVGFFRDKNCTEAISNGDYISTNDSVYVKQLSNLADNTRGLRINYRSRTSKGVLYLSGSGDVVSIRTENRGFKTFSIESYAKAKVTIDYGEYAGKLKFYADQACTIQIEDGDAFAVGTDIFAKLTLEGTGMTIPVHVEGETSLQNGASSLHNVFGEEVCHMTKMTDTDVTFRAKDAYYVQIQEEELGEINPQYSYTTDGESYQAIPEDGYVPYNSTLKIMAQGVTEDYVLVVDTFTDEIIYHKWYEHYKTIHEVMYTNASEVLVPLSYETPIRVSGAETHIVTLQKDIPNNSYVTCTYNNGTPLVSGSKLATDEHITVSVNGAPEGKAICTDYQLKAKDVDEYYGESGQTYHYYNREDSSEYDFTVRDDEVNLKFSIVPLRKATVAKPENYDIDVYWYDSWEEDGHYYDPEELYLVPEGEELIFESWSDGDLSPLRIDVNGKEGVEYLNSDSSARIKVKDVDYNVTMTPVSMYPVTFDSDMVELNPVDCSHGIYWENLYDEDDEYVGRKAYVPYGARVSVERRGVTCAEQYRVNAYHTGILNEKVFKDKYLTAENSLIEFRMPSFPVTIDTVKEECNKNVVNIKEIDFSTGSAASYKKYNSSVSTASIKDGDEVYNNQKIRVNADSVAENKKMLVTIKKTGTNEYATGTDKGMLIEGISSTIFRMFDFPITIEVAEKDRKGSGNAVSIKESFSNGTSVSYSVENGDLVAKNQDISLQIDKLKRGTSLAVNVICPDENMVASGSGITNDFSKPYFSKIVTTTGELHFAMPDYPIIIEVSETVNESDRINLAEASISLNEMPMYYTGMEWQPEYNVIYNGYILEKNVDYTESFTDNVAAGTAKVTITGIGSCTGSNVAEFVIQKRSLRDSVVSVDITNKVVFNYKPSYEPKPVIKIGDYQLTAGKDYTLSYTDNTSPTESATVKIIGINSMSDEIVKTFAIVSEKADLQKAVIRLNKDSFEYNGEEQKPEVTVFCNSEQLDESIDYEITYLNNVNAGKAIVKIRGLGNYIGEAKTEFLILARKLESSEFNASVANQKYKKSTKEYKPIPIITYAGSTLTEGIDYILAYENNSGETAENEPAKVIITGVHNYEGTRILTFEILKEYLDAAKLKVTVTAENLVYDGTEKQPGVIVKYKGAELLAGNDYEISYQNNVNAGKGKIVVVGIGEYAGSKTVLFSIGKKIISSAGNYTVDSIPAEVYNGANCPQPEVTDHDTGLVLSLSDVNYTYKNNKKVGMATINLKGVGNYKGKITKSFEIRKLAFSDYDYSIDDCVYTGTKQKPNVIATSLTTGERITLKTGTAVKAVFKNNVNIGDNVTAVISPKNKRFFDMRDGESTSKEIKFSIVKGNLENVTIMPIKDQKYKKGREIKPKLTVKVGTVKLKLNKDYKVTYSNNTEKGYGEATITSANEEHFTGSQTIKFVIK